MKEETSFIPRTPEDIPKLFAEFWNRRRADLLAGLFNEDADFINVVGLWWENRKAIFKAHDYGLKVIFNNSTLTIIRTKTKMLSDDFAIVHSKIKLTGQTPHKGTEAGKRRAILTFIASRKEDGIWSVISAQNTDIVGGMETNIRTKDGILHPVDYR
ncbi:MAG: SgcJ/EcaC family oxidoreductase [Chitinophagaceae bacterium]|nr:SgcJ/EcaC family oxidoreductase [Chitinophagaceae bacterium]